MKKMYQTCQIKEALLELAQLRGRQHYEMAVINQVVWAFRNDSDCILKKDVLEILESKYTATEVRELNWNNYPKPESVCDSKYKEFLMVCKSHLGAIKKLASLSKISAPTVSGFTGKGSLSVKNYEKMQPHFKTVLIGKPK